MVANDIDVSQINQEFKGCKVRVRPLYDINNMGKLKGYGLNLRLRDETRFKPSRFCPFCFEDEGEAKAAAAIINHWSAAPVDSVEDRKL